MAARAGLSPETLKYFLRQGVLQASVQRATGRGRGNVFGFADVIAAMSLNAMRLPNASAKPLQHLVAFWHSTRGHKLAQRLVQDMQSSEPEVLLITEKGVAMDMTPAALMKNEEVTVVFCLDARRLVEKLALRSTEGQILHEYLEPGPSGRVPPRTKGQKHRARKSRAQQERREPRRKRKVPVENALPTRRRAQTRESSRPQARARKR